MSSRVRPCNANAAIPASSARFATLKIFSWPFKNPKRVFKVTGTSTAAITASSIRATKSSSCNNAEPANLLHTFFAGHPILISTICAPFAT